MVGLYCKKFWNCIIYRATVDLLLPFQSYRVGFPLGNFVFLVRAVGLTFVSLINVFLMLRGSFRSGSGEMQSDTE